MAVLGGLSGGIGGFEWRYLGVSVAVLGGLSGGIRGFEWRYWGFEWRYWGV